MKHFVDLQNKINAFARGAYERLIMQTLWDTHPTSFQHSASEELLSIIKYFLRKHPLINFLIKCDCGLEYSLSETNNSLCSCKKVTKAFDKVNITWEMNRNDKISIDEFNKNEIPSPFIDVSFESWKIAIELNYYQYKNDKAHIDNFEIIKKDLKKIIIFFVKDLFNFYYKSRILFDFNKISPFLKQPINEVISTVVDTICSVFKGLTSKDISAEIMLYHPGSNGDGGFLFYPFYSQNESRLVKDNALESETDIFSTSIISIIKKDDDTFKEEDIKSHYGKYHNKINNMNGNNNLINLFKSILTSDVDGKSSADLLENNFLIDQAGAKKLPICYQPKGQGTAGRVATTYVTRVVQEIGHEEFLKYSERKQPAYGLMHMIEMFFGAKQGSSGIVTPMMGKGQLIGTLIVYRKRSKENGLCFTQAEIELIESLAYRVGKIFTEIKDYKFFKQVLHKYNNSKINKPDPINDLINNFLMHAFPFIINGAVLGILPQNNSKENMIKLEVENITENQIHIILPHPHPTNETPKYWIITMKLEEPIEIFKEHKTELETFLNYCWGVTGYAVDGLTTKSGFGVEV